jgi:adenylate cyclase
MKLIGDAIFAIWNAPQDQPNHQERACRAALLLNAQLIHFDATHRSLPLRTRVGLHCGTVYVGNIGSSARFDYTAIGESVNMASRLEGLNKYLGTNVLATRDICKPVAGQLVSRLAGHFKFKGFDQVVEVHELIGPLAEAEATRVWREAFGDALSRFQRKAFADAEAGFHETLKLRPDDGPSQFYLKQIAQLRLHPPPGDWVGEIDLQEK